MNSLLVTTWAHILFHSSVYSFICAYYREDFKYGACVILFATSIPRVPICILNPPLSLFRFPHNKAARNSAVIAQNHNVKVSLKHQHEQLIIKQHMHSAKTRNQTSIVWATQALKTDVSVSEPENMSQH